MMGKKNYKNDFKYSITILEMQGQKKLAQIYKDTTLKKYNIEI